MASSNLLSHCCYTLSSSTGVLSCHRLADGGVHLCNSWSMNTTVPAVPPLLRYGLLILNRNQQRSLLGIKQRAQGMSLREKPIWQAITAQEERRKGWVLWKGAVSYPSSENLQNFSVLGKFWSHYLHYLKYLDGLRYLLIVTRSDWDLVVLLDFTIRYVFIYLMIIIFIRHYYSLITGHYTKCFIYAILSTSLSTLWIRYYHYPHFLQIGKVKYSAKHHTSKWENGPSNPGNQKPKFTIYPTHRLHSNTWGSTTYPFLGNRLTDLWRRITPNSRSWHSGPIWGKAGSSTELSFLSQRWRHSSGRATKSQLHRNACSWTRSRNVMDSETLSRSDGGAGPRTDSWHGFVTDS